MNNEVEFVISTHNLLLKKVTEEKDCQFYKNMISSVQSSPQVARKKRFTYLNLERFRASNATTPSDISIFQEPEKDQREDNNWEPTSKQGSIDNTTALKQLTHE